MSHLILIYTVCIVSYSGHKVGRIKVPRRIVEDNNLKKLRLDISCELSTRQTVHMKYTCLNLCEKII